MLVNKATSLVFPPLKLELYHRTTAVSMRLAAQQCEYESSGARVDPR